MDTISNFVEGYSATFERCLLSANPVAEASSLPDSLEKNLILFLLQQHSQKFEEELKLRFKIKGDLLNKINQWKAHSRITSAKDTKEIAYLIEKFVNSNRSSFNYPRPAEFQATAGEEKNEEPSLPSKFSPIPTLSQWALEELKRNEDNIQSFTNKAIHALGQDKLMKLSVINKERLLSNNEILRHYSDQFAAEFVKSFYNQMLETNKNYEIPNHFFYNLSRSQFFALKEAIPNLVNKREYLQIWFSHKFEEDLTVFNKTDLTISEKDEKRKLLVRMLQELSELKTSKTKSFEVSFLRQILQLDVQREDVDKSIFVRYLRENPTSSSFEKAQYREQKYQKRAKKSKSYRESFDDDMDVMIPPSSQGSSEDDLIKQCLEGLFRKDDTEKTLLELQQFFESEKINKIFASVQLSISGNLVRYQNFFTAQELKVIKEQREITILDKNKRKWKSEDEVKLVVRVKNITQIHVQVYKLDLEKHFLENPQSEIDQTQSLSYLQPNHEYHYTIDNPNAYLIRNYDIKIEGIPAGRGVWIVELEGEGVSSRAFIRKGAFASIPSHNTAGAELRLYDETGSLVRDYSIWMENKKHAVSEVFKVPYGETDAYLNLVALKDGYGERVSLSVPRQSYTLDISYIYNTQSFIVGNIAKIILNPKLYVGYDSSLKASFKLLEKVKILVTLTNNLGIKSTVDFDNVQFKSNEDYLLEFPVQSYTRSIEIQVSAKVKKYNQKEETLSSSHGVQIKLNEENTNFVDIYLKKIAAEYRLYVLGRNGEPIPRTEANINYWAQGRTAEGSQRLLTDSEGSLHLGDLTGIERFTATVNLKSGFVQRSWDLSNRSQILLDTTLTFKEGEEINIPITRKQTVYLYKTAISGVILEKLQNFVTFDAKGLKIKGLKFGKYQLELQEEQQNVYITVIKGKVWEKENQVYDEKEGVLYEISEDQNKNLILGEAVFDKAGESLVIEIPVAGHYDFSQDSSLRAHIVASTFISPNFTGKFSPNNPAQNLKVQSFTTKASEFYNNKKLSEEASYTVNRRREKKFIGNNLEKPKIFLKKIEVRTTNQQQQVLVQEQNYLMANQSNRMRQMCVEKCSPYGDRAYGAVQHLRAGSKSMQCYVNKEDLTTHNNFLELSGTSVVNKRGSTLRFEVPHGYSHFTCYLFWKKGAIVKNYDVPSEQFLKKSLVHAGIEDINQTTGRTMSRQVYQARKGEAIKVGRDSVWAAVGLSNIAGFAKVKGVQLEDWVTNWSTYSAEEKLKVYDQKVCHQLNTFLKFNDSEFFELTVRPFIQNKVTKTFVDLCLLDRKETLAYTQLSLFGALNQFEKVLLVQQLVNAGRKQEAEQIVNTMESINKSERISFERFKKEFDTVITAKLTEEAKVNYKESEGLKMKKRKAAPKKQMRMENMDLMAHQQAECQQARFQMCCDDDDASCQDRGAFTQPFKQLQRTKQYTETTYSGIKNPQQSSHLVLPSPFWTSAAQHFVGGKGEFVTENFMYLAGKLEFTLACCFVPNTKLLAYDLKNQAEHVSIEPASSFVVFVREVKELPYEKKFGVLINQRFFNPEDRFYYEEDGTRIQKQVEQFISRRPYCIQTLITNTSGTKLELQLLIDIPQGSIPLKSHEMTQIQSINLEPYSTLSFERYFYFPAVGHYSLYPANACRGSSVIAKSEQIKPIEVLEKETIKKMDTLENVLKSGQKDAIILYLQTKNIFDSKIFDPSYILWMLSDKGFCSRVIEALRSRKYYRPEIWMFGYYHSDLAAISEYERVEKVESPENVLRNITIFEYFPYYSRRAHKFLDENKSTIRNTEFKKSYFCFLFSSLLNDPTSSRARLTFIYYLLLQDRIEEASGVLAHVSAEDRAQHKLQFDYIDCFIDMYNGYPTFSKARKIAAQYTEYPVKAWQKLFREITDTLRDYDSETVEEEKDVVEYTTTVLNEGSQLRISIPATTQVEVYFYGVNLQLYFSTYPFVEVQQFSSNIIPNAVQVYPAGASREEKLLRKDDMKDCFIEVYASTSGQVKKKVSSFLWNNPKIKISVKQQSGLAQVFYENKKQAGCYCKVYQMKAGESKFYRDGYTDITGTFKYALADLEGVTEFAILFVTENGGAVKRVKPPSQQAYFA